MRGLRVFIIGLYLFPLLASAQRLSVEQVPPSLQEWIPWVLHDVLDRACPFVYNDAQTRQCAWPGRLTVSADDRGGRFSQSWEVYADSWIDLPGAPKQWPQNVSVNDEPARVSARDGRPAVFLRPGSYQLQGEFTWDRLPETLLTPAHTGLMDLRIKDRILDTPKMRKDGSVWLKDDEPGQLEGEQEQLQVQVFRKIIDDIPLQVLTRVELAVSGRAREVVLGQALLSGFIPIRLQSSLPARIEAHGALRLQVRPGRWHVELLARHPQNLSQLDLQAAKPPWPKEEVWSFAARNDLRIVEIEGLPSIDPRQTQLPQDWHALPAFRIEAGQSMRFKVNRRGNPEPEPDQLRLHRQIWLDIDGQAYTVRDRIHGTMTRGWRLESASSLQLGRVLIDNQAQFITRLGDDGAQGVEVRRGQLELLADSRYEGPIDQIPIAWRHDFQQAAVDLYLPPGWNLLAAGGVDNVPDTWLQRWQLRDLFLVLLIALALAKLWGWLWGALSLLALALIWHAPGAPQFIFLHILGAVALLRVVPPGGFQRFLLFYRGASLLVLLAIAIPFIIEQVRGGFYPHLQASWRYYDRESGPALGRAPGQPADSTLTAAAPAILHEEALDKEYDKTRQAVELRKSAPPPPEMLSQQTTPALRFDPHAQVQTGPGVPRWELQPIYLRWSGPVAQEQTVTLTLWSPKEHLAMHLGRALLLALLLLLLVSRTWRDKRPSGNHKAVTAATLVCGLAILALPGAAARADYPPDALLEQLKQRLLAPPSCLPACALAPRMSMVLTPATLQLRMEVHATEHLAVPLPAQAQHWLPQEVLVNGEPAVALWRDSAGQLWLRLTPGIHQVSLQGPLPRQDSLQLPLPLQPQRVEVQADGWNVEGVHENGVADGQLQLTRERSQATSADRGLEPGNLPPLVRIQRTLHLGLRWTVDTQVVRASPPGSAVVLEVPLLPGESVVSEQVRIKNQRILVNLGPQQTRYQWQSALEQQSPLTLTAPQETRWTEIWRLDVSPIWHTVSSGIAAVQHQDAHGRWLPEWRPWPGESITLQSTKPQGVPGQTLTIDRSRLTVSPGHRATESQLELSLRSSQGGQHRILLPGASELQSVLINGRAQSLRPEADDDLRQALTLPVTPGTQDITVVWREPRTVAHRFGPSPVNLGISSVNHETRIRLGEARWVLYTQGPRIGPAVLIWGVLLVIVLIAVALGRTRLTPLRTWHWALLGIGLSQIDIWVGLAVVAWLLALGARGRLAEHRGKCLFNSIQVGLALFTLMALGMLLVTVQQGLLGAPDMHVAGNHSNAHDLRWFQDRIGPALPQTWVWSAPIWVYRTLMLAWALWLAVALLRWLRWGWTCYSAGGLWRPIHWRWRKRKDRQELASPPATDQ